MKIHQSYQITNCNRRESTLLLNWQGFVYIWDNSWWKYLQFLSLKMAAVLELSSWLVFFKACWNISIKEEKLYRPHSHNRSVTQTHDMLHPHSSSPIMTSPSVVLNVVTFLFVLIVNIFVVYVQWKVTNYVALRARRYGGDGRGRFVCFKEGYFCNSSPVTYLMIWWTTNLISLWTPSRVQIFNHRNTSTYSQATKHYDRITFSSNDISLSLKQTPSTLYSSEKHCRHQVRWEEVTLLDWTEVANWSHGSVMLFIIHAAKKGHK